MPELPEVETTGRGIATGLTGQQVVRVERRRAALRTPVPARLDAALAGARLVAVDRRGKYLLLRFDNRQTLLIHLGMSGRLTLAGQDDGARDRHDHLLLHFSSGALMRFNDPRRFGCVDMLETGTESEHPLLARLGPEPLARGFTAARLGRALAGRTTAIKTALLDQKLVAGIGNIYACEALFGAGIDPHRSAGSLKPPELERLTCSIRTVLRAAIRAGGSSLRDYVHSDGSPGFFQDRFAVYDREGQPCPGCTCRQGVQRITQGGRSTFWCPRRQV